MPMTLSHAAAVLPFRKSARLNFAALVIGSMSLDFSYVIALIGPRFEVHNLAGLFVFGVPITIISWWIFRFYLEPAWRSVFPWLTRETEKPVAPAIAFSALIGAVTHLLWDSCTHRYGFVVQAIPELSTVVSIGSLRPRLLYAVLQHLSTLVGGVILIFFLLRTLKEKKVRFIASRKRFVAAFAATSILTLIFCSALFAGAPFPPEIASFDAREFEVLLVKIVFRAMGAAAIVILLFPLTVSFISKRAES